MTPRMQTFYDWLSEGFEHFDAYWQSLAELTRLNPSQMVALESDLNWADWGSAAA